eukprot:CAMPEP_0206322252 /NCGR_PEP_ID=MMETSP0106_2-20121207/19326_1 /ASSEMBLY_ACC=CAM_ASM_000206 /TAXON_ID=81532 /ORGANISM="Acanthoeca-like sp., Strain 10tr" /LENGTH=49 /DNA_ID=CAMNT_0053754411 /DNA_START=21 /DNA_END=170 /DNA_ORIENTATION=-
MRTQYKNTVAPRRINKNKLKVEVEGHVAGGSSRVFGGRGGVGDAKRSYQ